MFLIHDKIAAIPSLNRMVEYFYYVESGLSLVALMWIATKKNPQNPVDPVK